MYVWNKTNFADFLKSFVKKLTVTSNFDSLNFLVNELAALIFKFEL